MKVTNSLSLVMIHTAQRALWGRRPWYIRPELVDVLAGCTSCRLCGPSTAPSPKFANCQGHAHLISLPHQKHTHYQELTGGVLCYLFQNTCLANVVSCLSYVSPTYRLSVLYGNAKTTLQLVAVTLVGRHLTHGPVAPHIVPRVRSPPPDARQNLPTQIGTSVTVPRFTMQCAWEDVQKQILILYHYKYSFLVFGAHRFNSGNYHCDSLLLRIAAVREREAG